MGSAELLQLASVVTVQHLLCNARAVGAGTPDMLLATRSQVMLEEQLTVFTAEDQVLLVVDDGVKDHLVLLTPLAHSKDIFLGFILLTAHLTAEHRNSTLVAE